MTSSQHKGLKTIHARPRRLVCSQEAERRSACSIGVCVATKTSSLQMNFTIWRHCLFYDVTLTACWIPATMLSGDHTRASHLFCPRFHAWRQAWNPRTCTHGHASVFDLSFVSNMRLMLGRVHCQLPVFPLLLWLDQWTHTIQALIAPPAFCLCQHRSDLLD